MAMTYFKMSVQVAFSSNGSNMRFSLGLVLSLVC